MKTMPLEMATTCPHAAAAVGLERLLKGTRPLWQAIRLVTGS
jgi:hypothetical protein